ncbi:Ig-like domain-containing protein [Marinicella marina]|uniref:Ig-like domain-containing protein n=1 Tax=Marinicella marina TaxID=2996016 RepID=UPI0024BC4C29|nr:Ig-like domain-containing protein [Marinicella marina]MDJ1140434.1 Ig-like domain-containing protein [Marinicella marina]
MKTIIHNAVVAFFMLSYTFFVQAGSPNCDGFGENYVGWPTLEPVWEMCYLSPENSSASRGSSLEVRNVHLNGFLVLERAHIPMLFANYSSGTCYRDWKDTSSNFLRADAIENPTRPAITTCDISVDEDLPVGNCPFQDVSPGGSGTVGNANDCTSQVQVEKYDDRMVITTNHSADWYKYSARYVFHEDGRIEPRFGFGNSDGTFSGTTHWHHAYWRFNFDIEGGDNDLVYIVDQNGENLQTTEFTDLREITSGKANDPNTFDDEVTWLVKDSVSGRGYRMVPGFDGDSQLGFIDDYSVPADPSLDNYHEVDVMVSRYKLINGSLTEYSDTPGQNSLGNCSMDETRIVDNETLVNEDPVLWYRAAVNDIANQGMLCKTAGPTLYPVGDWGIDQAPVAVADAAQVEENSVDNVLDLLSNDTDTDGGEQFIASVTQPVNGAVVIGVDGADVSYTPDVDYCNDGSPTDDFNYTLNGGSSATAAVTVTCFIDLDLIFEDGFE